MNLNKTQENIAEFYTRKPSWVSLIAVSHAWCELSNPKIYIFLILFSSKILPFLTLYLFLNVFNLYCILLLCFVCFSLFFQIPKTAERWSGGLAVVRSASGVRRWKDGAVSVGSVGARATVSCRWSTANGPSPFQDRWRWNLTLYILCFYVFLLFYGINSELKESCLFYVFLFFLSLLSSTYFLWQLITGPFQTERLTHRKSSMIKSL